MKDWRVLTRARQTLFERGSPVEVRLFRRTHKHLAYCEKP